VAIIEDSGAMSAVALVRTGGFLDFGNLLVELAPLSPPGTA